MASSGKCVNSEKSITILFSKNPLHWYFKKIIKFLFGEETQNIFL